MTTPLLTVGMATVDDWEGCYFSIQSMRLHNDLRDVELIVVDNKPDVHSSRHLKVFLGKCHKGTAGVRYIPMAAPTGTTQARNRIFSEATAPSVLCMDSHVLVQPGALQRLLAYYHDTGSNNLLTGPLLYDDLHTISTHMNNEWGSDGMWGTWGQAWMCRCYRIRKPEGQETMPLLFSVVKDGEVCQCRELASQQCVQACPRCDHGLPEGLPFNGHEEQIRNRGYYPIGTDLNDMPFEVPGQGLGLFTCRKEAWLGFNEHFRGFGGEEMYIHHKYKQAGRKTVCLPFLRWVHRFYRPLGLKYPVSIWDRVRNYVLGCRELGLDEHVVYDQFVKPGILPQEQWDFLVHDPIGHETWIP